MFHILISLVLGVAAIPVVVTVNQSDITIYVYNQSNPQEYVYSFNLSDTSEVGDYVDCSKLPVLVVIHGWGGQDNYTSYIVVQTVARIYDINILGVDYPNDVNYFDNTADVSPIGKFVGEFIDTLVNEICEGITYDDVRIVGHSLGAHISGVVGRTVKESVASIVALDPAGPGFTLGADNALAPTDAKIVQVIHTNGGLLGTNDRNGQSNFYPNGGVQQPGCYPFSNCAHLYALKLYADSLNSPGSLRARLCFSYNVITTTLLCIPIATAGMGGLIPEQLSGDYYLATNDNEITN